MTISINQIKQLRESTGGGIMDCRRALEETNVDMKKAADLIKKWGAQKAEKKSDRATAQGIIYTYVHHGNKIGVMVELNCETDFVARTDEFKTLARELSLQIASMNPKDVDTLLSQEYIRDGTQTMKEMIKSVIGKLGENIAVKRFVRYEIGQ